MGLINYLKKLNWTSQDAPIQTHINKWEQGISDCVDELNNNSVKVDGTTPFTAEQIGVDPTSPQGLATLNKVNSLISAIDVGTKSTANMPTLANNSTDANNDIDFSTGFCWDLSTNIKITNIALTKRLDATFVAGTNQGGLDTGSKANSTWYACFAISKADGTADFLFSTSATAPTMPTDYINKRRIGSIRTDGSGNIMKFLQFGNDFLWDTEIVEATYTALNPTTINNLTLTTPIGIKTMPYLIIWAYNPSQASGVKIHDLNFPSKSLLGQDNASSGNLRTVTGIFTNNNSQIGVSCNNTTTFEGVFIRIHGYTDKRGKN